MKKKLKYLLLSILVSFLFSCSQIDEKKESERRLLVDSIVQVRIDTLTPVLDSLCAIEIEGKLQKTVDSIIQERLKKIERTLREKRKKINQ